MASERRPRELLIVRPTLGQGGADRVTLLLLQNLDRSRIRPTLAVMRAEGPWLERLPDDVPVIELGTARSGLGRRLYTAWWPLARLLRRTRPDVLLSTSGGANLIAALGHRMARSRARLVLSERLTLRRDDRGPWKTGALAVSKRLLYRRADCIIAVSTGLKRELEKQLGLASDRIFHVDNPIVTPELEQHAAEPLSHPWFEGSAPEPAVPVILAAGRLVEAKDFAMLISALARLRTSRPARLVVLGDGPLRSRLTELAAELGVEEAVSLPGFDPNPYRYMARCSVFALSSRFEGMPGVLVQAMACGAPVVATDCETGPREVLRDGYNGLLVPVGDADAMAAALGRLLADHELRRRLVERGRTIVTRFEVEPAVRSYEALLDPSPATRGGQHGAEAES